MVSLTPNLPILKGVLYGSFMVQLPTCFVIEKSGIGTAGKMLALSVTIEQVSL